MIDAEARQAKLGNLSDVREPSRAWSRTRAPRAIGRRGGGTSAALFSMVGAWLKKWLGWMDQDGMVVGWLSSGWTDGCVRMGQDKDGWSADE